MIIYVSANPRAISTYPSWLGGIVGTNESTGSITTMDGEAVPTVQYAFAGTTYTYAHTGSIAGQNAGAISDSITATKVS